MKLQKKTETQSNKKQANSFKERVCRAVKRIPKGETLTYAEVALRAGSANASRAVGRIMANNYDENIPCHRVVRSDGKVGDYNRGGARRKLIILNNERRS